MFEGTCAMEDWFLLTIAAHMFAALIAALMFPMTLLFARRRIRDRRQRVIADLSKSFFENADSLPILDYVKSKYNLHHANEPNTDESFAALLISAVPYLVLSWLGFVLLLTPISHLLPDKGRYVSLLAPAFFWGDVANPADADLARFGLIIAVSFLGAYLFTAKVMMRAVQNYELSQLIILRCGAQLAAGVISAFVMYRTLYTFAGEVDIGNGTIATMSGVGVWIGLAFFCGYVPDLGLTLAARRLRLSVMKAVDSEALKAIPAVPLEILDGITYDVRYRLDEANVADLQNLATANPLLLFVETPFGLYETLDWVLQAQLCLVVGSKRFVLLKQHNIRTVFDLERVVLGDDAPAPLVNMIGEILFSEPATVRPTGGDGMLDLDSVRYAVMTMLDDLHVHRLRQLWQYIYKQIGPPEGGDWLYRTTSGLVPRRETSIAVAAADALVVRPT
jgi:hypothetical protein